MAARKLETTVRNLFFAQLGNLTALPAGWAPKVIRSARLAGDTDVLVQLAGRGDLDQGSVAELAEIADPSVRVAILTNTALPQELRRRLAANERRVSVLAPVLVGQPELLVDLVAVALEERPTVGLAKAVLAAGRRSADAAVNPIGTGLLTRALEVVIGRRPVLNDQERSDVLAAADVLAEVDPDVSTLARVLTAGGGNGTLLASPDLRVGTRRQILEIWASILSPANLASALYHGVVALYENGQDDPAVVRVVRDAVGAQRGYLDGELLGRIEAVLSLIEDPQNLDRLRSVVTDDLRAVAVSARAFRELLAHPGLGTEELKQLLGRLNSIPRGVDQFWDRLDDATVEQLAVINPGAFIALGGAERLSGDPDAALRVLHALRSTATATHWGHLPRSVEWVAAIAPALFEELTWGEIEVMTSSFYYRDDHRRVIMELLAERTASLSDEQWSTFHGLCGSWQSTVGELLAAATAL